MNRLANKIDIDKTSLNLIMLINCFLCFFEEVVEMHIVVLIFYAAALVLMALKKKLTIVRGSAFLLLYAAGIFVSIAFNGTSFRAIYRAALAAMMVMYATIADQDADTLNSVKRGFVLFGMFHAALVLLQFLLKDTLTLPFYALLNEKAQVEAMFYYERGYYAGLNVKPHETAGVIFMAIAVMLTTKREGKSQWELIVPAFMLIALFLTGKRAVTILTIGCAVLLYGFIQVVHRRWRRVFCIVGALAAAGAFGLLLIKLFPHIPFFGRFATAFESGSLIDDTRLTLWSEAMVLFREKPLFGIGWSNFNELSMDRFGHLRSHSVNLDYLQWLCETGVIGFVLMIAPVVYTVIRAIKLGFYTVREQLSVKERNLVFMALYVQFFILLYALIEVPFYNNLFFALYVYSCIVVHTFYTKYLANEKAEKWQIDLTKLTKPRCGVKNK